MTSEQFADKMGRRIKALTPSVTAADALTLADSKGTAVTLSSGGLTRADLARAGHPFAVRAPNAAFAPYQINKGSGEYLRGWKTEGPEQEDGRIVSRLFNVSNVAQFLVPGTRIMVSRDQRPQIMAAARRVRKGRIVAAVANALKS